MPDAMTFRQMNRAIFAGEPVPHVFFQPRIEPWYAWHNTFHQMPPAYADMDIQTFFDDLDVSMRYVHYYTGMPSPIVDHYTPAVKIREQFEGDVGWRTFETPYGDLTEKLHMTPDEVWRTVEFAVKAPGDLKALRWLYENRVYEFSSENFAQGAAFVGDRGEPQFWVPRSPYQALALDWMRYETFIYALTDSPDELVATFEVINRSYDELYRQLCAAENLHIVNYGENVHAHLLPPSLFERYVLPWYEERSGQLRAAGKFTHVHIDGACKPLLPYIKDMPFDGIEALTPQPQGDVTVEEIAEAMGDKILLDGIPAVLFLDMYPREELMACVEQLVDLLHPRLVLGASDEVPEGANAEAMDRVRMIAQWARSRG
jgi:hypothetical protein